MSFYIFEHSTGSWDSEHCGVGDSATHGRDRGEVLQEISI